MSFMPGSASRCNRLACAAGSAKPVTPSLRAIPDRPTIARVAKSGLAAPVPIGQHRQAGTEGWTDATRERNRGCGRRPDPRRDLRAAAPGVWRFAEPDQGDGALPADPAGGGRIGGLDRALGAVAEG